jgi:excisionase family DNA binding protein
MNKSDDLKPVYLPEIIKKLGSKESTVRRLFERGELPKRKIGGKIMILQRELNEYLEKGTLRV